MHATVATALVLVLLLPRARTEAAASKEIHLSKLPPAANVTVDFVRDIQPLLAERCVKCHGREKQKGGLRLDARAAAMEGAMRGRSSSQGRARRVG